MDIAKLLGLDAARRRYLPEVCLTGDEILEFLHLIGPDSHTRHEEACAEISRAAELIGILYAHKAEIALHEEIGAYTIGYGFGRRWFTFTEEQRLRRADLTCPAGSAARPSTPG